MKSLEQAGQEKYELLTEPYSGHVEHAFLVCTISFASILADLMSPLLAASRTCFSADSLCS